LSRGQATPIVLRRGAGRNPLITGFDVPLYRIGMPSYPNKQRI
jgi:hypothetical protein